MGLFDALNTAQQGMAVHRYRSEVAAENLANIYTPGYQRKVVDLASSPVTASSGGGSRGTTDAQEGAVRITGTHVDPDAGDVREQTLLGVSDMMEAKGAFELNARVATMIKSMATAALEIGRGG